MSNSCELTYITEIGVCNDTYNNDQEKHLECTNAASEKKSACIKAMNDEINAKFANKIGGKKSKNNRKRTLKKGGSASLNSQVTVLQPASYAPSLDNSSVKTGSILVGGKKKRNKRTQKRRSSSTRKYIR